MDLEKSNSADSFLGTMAEKLGAVARAATVFGDPVEQQGVTVIPVAKARWGFGGGVGHGKDEEGAGGRWGTSHTSWIHRDQKWPGGIPCHQNAFNAVADPGWHLDLTSVSSAKAIFVKRLHLACAAMKCAAAYTTR